MMDAAKALAYNRCILCPLGETVNLKGDCV